MITYEVTELGTILRSLRKSRGLSLKEAAEQLEMTDVQLGLIELGKTKGIMFYILKKMEKAYGVKLQFAVTIGEQDYKRMLSWQSKNKQI